MSKNTELKTVQANQIIEVPTQQTEQYEIAQAGLGGILSIGGGALIVASLIGAGAFAYVRYFRQVPASNQAFVITGGRKGGKSKADIVVGGACFIVPGIHRITKVPLQQFDFTIPVELYTKDPLCVTIDAVIHVKVDEQGDAILTAAKGIGNGKEVTKSAIEDRVEEEAQDSIRTAGQQMQFTDIRNDKQKLAESVRKLMEPDLKSSGLALISLSVKDIKQVTISENDPDIRTDVLKAQALRVQQQLVTAAEIEKQRTLKDEAEEILAINEAKETAKQEQQARVAALKATKNREVKEKDLAELELEELAQLRKDQKIAEEQSKKSIADARLANEQEIAEKAQLEALRVQEILTDKAIREEQIKRETAIKIAEEQQQVAAKQADIQIAQAEKLRLEAEAERIKAEVQSETVRLQGEAERQKKLELIQISRETEEMKLKSEAEAEKDRLEAETDAEKQKLERLSKATAEAEATIALAEAKSKAATLEAQALNAKTDAEKKAGLAEAEALEAINNAKNVLSSEVLIAEQLADVDLEKLLTSVFTALKPNDDPYSDATIILSGSEKGGMEQLTQLKMATSSATVLDSLAKLLSDGSAAALVNGLINKISESKDTTHSALDTSEPHNVQID